jgi:uncharacterized membrane protein
MKKPIDGSIKALFGSVGIVIGWTLNALAWSGYFTGTMASIAIILGVVLFSGSIIYLIAFRRKQQITDFNRPRSIQDWLFGLNLNIVNPTTSDIEDLDRLISYEDLKVWMEGKEFIPSV